MKIDLKKIIYHICPSFVQQFPSIVGNWLSFAASDAAQTMPRCRLCLKAVAIKGSSTTNLFQHVKQKHAAEWETCCSLRTKNHTSRASMPGLLKNKILSQRHLQTVYHMIRMARDGKKSLKVSLSVLQNICSLSLQQKRLGLTKLLKCWTKVCGAHSQNTRGKMVPEMAWQRKVAETDGTKIICQSALLGSMLCTLLSYFNLLKVLKLWDIYNISQPPRKGSYWRRCRQDKQRRPKSKMCGYAIQTFAMFLYLCTMHFVVFFWYSRGCILILYKNIKQ